MRSITTALSATALIAALFLLPSGPADAVVPTQVVRDSGTASLHEDSTASPTARGISISISSGESLVAGAVQEEPAPEAEAGRFAFVLIPLLAAAVIVVGAVFVISRGRRRRRGD
ncbi:hypothetical protein QE418_002207 [Microbacterium testaceum]|uniref:hypothetical protein n=1 Tax=Microbacterium TaxID=33882 RepID=UPI00278269D1|nr:MULTISPECIES: hypothetical protein [Microbacterium]MDQ1112759.1 hypothetical protein [Microbacterium testaceum]MDR6096703.1 hypothetical protein [Microbacterium sp. SORGH_AS_0454]